jgi:hypothetical protein
VRCRPGTVTPSVLRVLGVSAVISGDRSGLEAHRKAP